LLKSSRQFRDIHKADFQWTLSCIEVQARDISDRAHTRFPIMLAITLMVVAVLVRGAMRSIVLPLRLIVTVGWTVAWTFGLESFVFCKGIFDYISPSVSNHGEGEGLYWAVPLLLTTILVCLGCASDIFCLLESQSLGKKENQQMRRLRRGIITRVR
jgi:uncharacterized membrane protein YdfJ with MMPL/SSD domain